MVLCIRNVPISIIHRFILKLMRRRETFIQKTTDMRRSILDVSVCTKEKEQVNCNGIIKSENSISQSKLFVSVYVCVRRIKMYHMDEN